MSKRADFGALLEPKSIVVVGASSTAVAAGNRFLRHLKTFGYPGHVWPIHRSAATIEGLHAYPSFAELPGVADYAYVAVRAAEVADVLREARGRIRIAQVMSSGFGETQDGAGLESEMVAAAREAGIRVVGPNCLGVHSPRARVTFTERHSAEPGPVGIVCQSGGLGVDIIRRGQARGLRFSGVVTVGNCADVEPWELLEHFFEDPRTGVVGLYLETARGGRRLFEVLRDARAGKPVVLLKGGSTLQGRAAAASHTGALAGSESAWDALTAQTGLVRVETLDGFVDALLAFQCLESASEPVDRIVLFGNGGGASVLGADAFARRGFELERFDDTRRAQLEALALPAGSSVRNPIDVPAGALQQGDGRAAERILEIVCETARTAVVVHVNMAVALGFRHVDLLGGLVRAVLRVRERAPAGARLMLVLRSDGEAEAEQRKRECRGAAVAAGIPVFDEIDDAAAALQALRHFERHRARRQHQSRALPSG